MLILNIGNQLMAKIGQYFGRREFSKMLGIFKNESGKVYDKLDDTKALSFRIRIP